MWQVNYNDAADGREDLTWQEQGSDYNSDFSLPSDNDNDDEFDEKNESEYTKYFNLYSDACFNFAFIVNW